MRATIVSWNGDGEREEKIRDGPYLLDDFIIKYQDMRPEQRIVNAYELLEVELFYTTSTSKEHFDSLPCSLASDERWRSIKRQFEITKEREKKRVTRRDRTREARLWRPLSYDLNTVISTLNIEPYLLFSPPFLEMRFRPVALIVELYAGTSRGFHEKYYLINGKRPLAWSKKARIFLRS